MRSPLPFLRSHSYELMVTAMVIALGVASRQLRTHRQTAPDPSPTTSPVTATQTAVPAKAPVMPQWLRPVSGGMLTAHSPEAPCWNADMDCWQTHAGVDLAAAPGESVRAAAEGAVLSVTRDPLLGLTVRLTHADGFESLYASLDAAACAPGDILKKGDLIGTAGNSADSEALLGCHLHFELLQDDLPIKPGFSHENSLNR